VLIKCFLEQQFASVINYKIIKNNFDFKYETLRKNFDFWYEILRKNFEIFSNFEVLHMYFETSTSVFEVEILNFETSTSNYFDTRNAEAYYLLKIRYIFDNMACQRVKESKGGGGGCSNRVYSNGVYCLAWAPPSPLSLSLCISLSHSQTSYILHIFLSVPIAQLDKARRGFFQAVLSSIPAQVNYLSFKYVWLVSEIFITMAQYWDFHSYGLIQRFS